MTYLYYGRIQYPSLVYKADRRMSCMARKAAWPEVVAALEADTSSAV